VVTADDDDDEDDDDEWLLLCDERLERGSCRRTIIAAAIAVVTERIHRAAFDDGDCDGDEHKLSTENASNGRI
jgi:hypothetical protein